MKNIRHILFVVAVLPLTLTTGCFKMGSLFGNAGGNGGNNVNLSTSSQSVMPKVVEGSQVMSSLIAQTGVTAPSTTTKNTFTAQASNFNATGDYSKIGAAWHSAHATLAAEFCNDAITQSPTKLYPGVNFTTGPAQFTGTELANVSNALCRNFFRHDCTSTELSALQSGAAKLVSDVNTGNTAAVQTKTVAIGLCTGVASSMGAVVH